MKDHYKTPSKVANGSGQHHCSRDQAPALPESPQEERQPQPGGFHLCFNRDDLPKVVPTTVHTGPRCHRPGQGVPFRRWGLVGKSKVFLWQEVEVFIGVPFRGGACGKK